MELGGKMITVTVVRISADFSIARVYLSIFPVKKDEDPLKPVHEHAGQIRHELGQKIRNQLRIVPELHYFIDDSLDYIENIENLLKE